MAHADAEDLVGKCDGCQKFSRRAHVPAQELRMIPITWPFAALGAGYGWALQKVQG